MLSVLLHHNHLGASARQEFERYASRAAKEVERGGFLEVEVGTQHIEKIFFGKVCGGTRLEGTWHLKATAFVFSGNYTHDDGRELNVEQECHEVVRHAGRHGHDVAIVFAGRVDGVNTRSILGRRLPWASWPDAKPH